MLMLKGWFILRPCVVRTVRTQTTRVKRVGSAGKPEIRVRVLMPTHAEKIELKMFQLCAYYAQLFLSVANLGCALLNNIGVRRAPKVKSVLMYTHSHTSLQ